MKFDLRSYPQPTAGCPLRLHNSCASTIAYLAATSKTVVAVALLRPLHPYWRPLDPRRRPLQLLRGLDISRILRSIRRSRSPSQTLYISLHPRDLLSGDGFEVRTAKTTVIRVRTREKKKKREKKERKRRSLAGAAQSCQLVTSQG